MTRWGARPSKSVSEVQEKKLELLPTQQVKFAALIYGKLR